MNFLAHAHLSGPDHNVLFGNFIADAVKGNGFNKFSDDIRAGIILHRSIDSYTDRHVQVRQSIARVRPSFGKYSGIAIDIFYDHFLAAAWSQYDQRELSDFTVDIYKILAKRFLLLPTRTKRMLPFMIAQNWLNSYANLKDLERIFYGMDRRTHFKSGMVHAVKVLEANYEDLRADFELFYPLLSVFTQSELAKIAPSNK